VEKKVQNGIAGPAFAGKCTLVLLSDTQKLMAAALARRRNPVPGEMDPFRIFILSGASKMG
jgi:hypothetical protein